MGVRCPGLCSVARLFALNVLLLPKDLTIIFIHLMNHKCLLTRFIQANSIMRQAGITNIPLNIY